MASVKQLASTLVAESGLTPPIDPLSICRKLGVEVWEEELDTLCGFALRVEDKKLIVIAKNMCSNRKRWTLAHELGHIILKHDCAAQFGEKSNSLRVRKQERLANKFAEELLMPLKEINKVTSPTPSKVARLFRVSEDAARIRLANLGII